MGILAIINTVRQTLMSNADIYSLVAAREYPQYLASIKNPVYPCITIWFNDGKTPGVLKEYREGSIIVSAHSQKSYKEGYEIQECIYKALHQKKLVGQGIVVIVKEFGVQLPSIEKEEDMPTTYSIHSTYIVTGLER
jgi:hypothetical protein